MKIYLTDKYSIKNYTLPSKIEDTFVIEYVSSSGVSENILFTAVEGKWTIASDYDVNVYKEVEPISYDEIKDGSFYTLKFRDLEESINLFCFNIPQKYYSYSIFNKNLITIGGANSDIIFPILNQKSPIITLKKEGIKWFFETKENYGIFVNTKRYHKKVLNLGDIIFLNGLKIIFMDKFIKVNNPNNYLTINLDKETKLQIDSGNNFTPVKDSEKRIVLFNENQTFFHAPRLKKEITKKEIKIANPPAKREIEDPPLILTMGATIMMSLSSSITGIIAIFNVISGKSTLASSFVEIIICIGMIGGTIMFPMLLNKYTRRQNAKRERNRQIKYTEYLNKKRNEIDNEIKIEKQILYENNLNAEECLNAINTKNKFWNREITDNDFLTIRLGVGNIKSAIKLDTSLEEFSVEDDNLKDEVQKLIATPLILEEVPITISLVENNILPLIIEPTFKFKEYLINFLIIQLVTYYSASDLKIVILTNENNKYLWESLKYTFYSKGKKGHFFSEKDEDSKAISTYLEDIFNEREKNNNSNNNVNDSKKIAYKNYNEYYLIITDNFIETKKLGIIDKIINAQDNYGFSLLTIDQSLKNVPSKSNRFIQINETLATISNKNLSAEETINFKVEILDKKIDPYLELVANVPISLTASGNSLPTSINFLEMYKVGKIEQLNILNRWLSSDPTITLSVPIGVNEDGKLFTLDLHEKAQGPHGLIAGATGSGKSEFIITFILSLAMNYHPYEVQFVLIDYKGGGLAGAFENKESNIKLPHLVGTITNLDKSEMNRTLVSIKSELQRRQHLFNLAREKLGESTIDIYKYQKFYRENKLDIPISHLFIISDEFAELKTQQPDFMEELVSTARIGRSLGVHLILATQKPSGIVDDQIWSNARFKVCLKVQTPEDSNELLKRPDAATINETGRFYLQVGYNETFELGQSAWSGARYFPSERLMKFYDDDIIFINNVGEEIKVINDETKIENQQDRGDQLSNLVKYMFSLANREKINFTQLWLPSIPKEIYLGDLIKKYNYQTQKYLINPLVGEYDIPMNQEQKPLIFDFSNQGNLYIFGNPGSGKENLLMTTLYSIGIYHTSEEINIYIVDLGAETLKAFSSFPQVGDVLLSDEIFKIDNLFDMLENELNRRKELFSDFGGSYISYINSGNFLPFILVIINNYENFYDNCGNADEKFNSILRDSTKYGINFIITATANNNVSTRISQYFNIKLATQVADPFDYKFVLNAPSGLVPAKYFGRGIIGMGDTAYEFQSAYIYLKEKIVDTIKDIGEKMNFPKARNIPVIPKNINSDIMIPYINSFNDVPIGYNVYNGIVIKYNFANQKITPIIGESLLLENKFITNLIKILNSIPTIKLTVIDFASSLYDFDGEDYYINSEFTQAIENIKTNNNDKITNVYILNGISVIYDKVLDEGINSLFDTLSNLNIYSNSYFILSDNFAPFKKTIREKWYINSNINSMIWVGKGIDSQNLLSISKINKADLTDDNSIIYVIYNNQYEVIKGLGTGEL